MTNLQGKAHCGTLVDLRRILPRSNERGDTTRPTSIWRMARASSSAREALSEINYQDSNLLTAIFSEQQYRQ